MGEGSRQERGKGANRGEQCTRIAEVAGGGPIAWRGGGDGRVIAAEADHRRCRHAARIEHAAVAMIRVLAQANIGDYHLPGQLALQRPHPLLHGALGIPRPRPLGVLVRGDAEEDDGMDAFGEGQAAGERAGVPLPPSPPTFAPGDRWLVVEKILAAARDSGAQAIHPGYGFLSENAAFAEACEAAGIAFVGPTPKQLRVFGLKHTARALAKQHGVPMLEGTELLENLDAALLAGDQVGYPVMLKSTAGGGGIGMRVCRSAQELAEAFEVVKRLGQNNFSDAGVFIEKYIQRARHLEVQVFGDGKGEVIALGVRDCSVQRRNQKVLEETPAPNLPAGMAEELCAAAIKLARAVKYRSAGTVEFVYDSEAERFYFLEVNTRLQVEHGVTEQVWGVDLVRWMIELAAGDLPPLSELAKGLKPDGHAIQARLYAEDPGRDFQPSPGLLTAVDFPAADGKALRIDTWVEAGCEIPPYFDPMIAKFNRWAPTREAASAGLDRALADSVLYGVECNRDYLRQIIQDAPFASGNAWTRCLENLEYRANTLEVLSAGTQTTVQDFPGRIGYWAVGVPPSGPMDDLAFRLANRIVGNDAGLYEQLKSQQNDCGAVPGPFDCWLTLRGIKTLPVRMDRHGDNAMAVALFLSGHPAVAEVYYPGIPGSAGHDIAARQMRNFGGMVSFRMHSREAAIATCNGTRIFQLAESLGGVESLIEHPDSMTHLAVSGTEYAIDGGVIRLSVGIENIDDLLADLGQALEKAG